MLEITNHLSPSDSVAGQASHRNERYLFLIVRAYDTLSSENYSAVFQGFRSLKAPKIEKGNGKRKYTEELKTFHNFTFVRQTSVQSFIKILCVMSEFGF